MPLISSTGPTKWFAETQVPFTICSLTVQRFCAFLLGVPWILKPLTNIHVENPLISNIFLVINELNAQILVL